MSMAIKHFLNLIKSIGMNLIFLQSRQIMEKSLHACKYVSVKFQLQKIYAVFSSFQRDMLSIPTCNPTCYSCGIKILLDLTADVRHF